MTIAPQKNMRVRPVLPQQAQDPLHDHGVLRPGRAFTGTQDGGHQGSGVVAALAAYESGVPRTGAAESLPL